MEDPVNLALKSALKAFLATGEQGKLQGASIPELQAQDLKAAE
jgi:hypothetical protein